MIRKMMEGLEALKDSPLAIILEKVLDDAAALTGSRLAYFAIMNGNEDVLTMIGWSKTSMENCRLITKPIVYSLEDTGLWGDAVRERKHVITNDYKGLVKPTKKGCPSGHVDIKNHMNLPVIKNGKVKSIIGVGNRDFDYEQEQVELLTEYACFAWNIIENKIPDELAN